MCVYVSVELYINIDWFSVNQNILPAPFICLQVVLAVTMYKVKQVLDSDSEISDVENEACRPRGGGDYLQSPIQKMDFPLLKRGAHTHILTNECWHFSFTVICVLFLLLSSFPNSEK